MGNNHSVSLLDLLQKKVGCSYLSDLHDPHFFDLIQLVVLSIDSKAYTVKEWNDAASYILGTPTDFPTQNDTIHFLIMHLGEKVK